MQTRYVVTVGCLIRSRARAGVGGVRISRN